MDESSAGSPEEGRPPNALNERVARALALPDAVPGATETAHRDDATTRTSRADGTARFYAGLALLLSLAAAGVAGWTYLYPRTPDLSAVQSAIGTAGTSLRDAQSSMARLGEQLADMRKRVDELAAADAAANREMETLRDQTMETAEATQRLAVGDAFTSKRWMRTEAEHLMQAANIALRLNHDPATALAALEGADQRLAELSDPVLMNVRAKLTDEIAAVRALPRPDVEGIALTLGSMAARVEMLPVAGVAQVEGERAAPPDQSAWQRAVAKMTAALKSMVTVQRTSGSAPELLAPEERFFLYRNLELELESARLAALEGDAANYGQSLQSARRWLEARFERSDGGVQSTLDAIAELQSVELVTSWPDISGSLAELHKASPQ